MFSTETEYWLPQERFTELYGTSSRTLTYWREQDQLGPLVRVGNHYYMTPQDQEKALILAKIRGPATEEVIRLTLEGDQFQITKVEVTRRDGQLLAKLFTKQGGYLVKELEEEALNGLQ